MNFLESSFKGRPIKLAKEFAFFSRLIVDFLHVFVSVAFAYHSSKTLSSWKRYKISFYPTNTVQKHSRKHNFSLVFPFKILSLRFVRPLKKLSNLCTCFFRTPTTAFPARKSTSHFINWKKWLVKISFSFRNKELPKSKKCLHKHSLRRLWKCSYMVEIFIARFS